ncbi:hypothetical protein [Sphingomicrobium clamense]|uniref:Uncharacterized protein n=1 Tax=Sphingomicrobium clamense TaxID=2851013 RepID=A0ABS6V839_9SPHN|nr:hypothetical protein [Sphingomicrobium sp. B8]MBW0145223.1 hypothetical protein [Sphingomicrobium sp. B8]
MAAAMKENLRLGLATTLCMVGAFWWTMEDYQKDRVATLVVQSPTGLIETDAKSDAIEEMVAEEGLEPPTRGSLFPLHS